MQHKKIINFRDCDIDDLDSLEIAICLYKRENNLEIFQISMNSLTNTGIINIIKQLQWFSGLKEIYFGELKINNKLKFIKGKSKMVTEIGLNSLIETLSLFANLKILFLNECNLNDESLILLTYSLEVIV